jgi:hypothetical protein
MRRLKLDLICSDSDRERVRKMSREEASCGEIAAWLRRSDVGSWPAT